MIETFEHLSSDVYHEHPNWGSTNLKAYLQGAANALYEKENHESEQSGAMRLGSLVHGILQGLKYKVIPDPINPKTGKFYGSETKEVKSLLNDVTALQSEYEIAHEMVNNFANHNAKFFESCMTGEREFSHFVDLPTHRLLKIRPDAKTKTKMVDYKKVKKLDWNRKKILSLCYDYSFQAAMYQNVGNLVFGELIPVFWVFMLDCPPFDTIIVKASELAYDDSKNYISLGDGALKYERVLRLHNECINSNQWLGLANEIEPDTFGNRFANVSDLKN